MKASHLSIAVAATAAAALAIGQARAADPSPAACPPSDKTTAERAAPGTSSETQQAGPEVRTSMAPAQSTEGAGSGGDAAGPAGVRQQRQPQGEVSYPLPSSDPELERLSNQ